MHNINTAKKRLNLFLSKKQRTIGDMAYIQLINLFIIFGLISYSYELNIRRRVRDTDFEVKTQAVLDRAFKDEKQIEDKNDQYAQEFRRTIKVISVQISEAAEEMAEAGSRDVTNTDKWVNIQGKLREGINLIIGAYRKFIDVHRQSCKAIEDFANDIIDKYEKEITAINQMSVPTSLIASGGDDTNKPDFGRLMDFMLHARYHEQTLPIAADCVGDAFDRIREHRSAIMSQVAVHTTEIQVLPPVPRYAVPQYVNPQYSPGRVILPCGAIDQYNGNQICANAIADRSGVYAQQACGCQPGAVQAVYQ